MKIKAGVKLIGLVPQAVLAMPLVDKIYAKYGKDLVITSVSEGKHKRASAHKTGRAWDGRINYFSDQIALKVKKEVKAALGSGYDVILEMIPYKRRHLHIEWDPK